MSSIFLSASVPSSDSEYYKGCSPVLIQAALRAFLFSVVGRKHLVFGGHPSISPLILAVCEELGIKNKNAVTIFQSKYFEASFPTESLRFANLVLTPAAETVEKSLSIMRKQIFTDFDYDSAVFIGGKKGITQEYRLFRRMHPYAIALALHSPGGAASMIGGAVVEDDELLDYDRLFIKNLNISKDFIKEMPAPKRSRAVLNDKGV
jgi:hypothetical protein